MGFWDVLFLQTSLLSLGRAGLLLLRTTHFFDQPVDTRCGFFFFVRWPGSSTKCRHVFPEERRLYVLVQGSLWRFSRLRCGLDLLGVHDFLFSWLFAGQHFHERVMYRCKGAELAQDRTYLLVGSMGLFFIAVTLNIIGLNVGKWLQNAGGVSTYLPLLISCRDWWSDMAEARFGHSLHVVEHDASGTGTLSISGLRSHCVSGLELVSAMSGG